MKLRLAAVLLTTFIFLAFECCILRELSKHNSTASISDKPTIDNVAFTATKDKSNWVITLKPGHFHQSNPSNSFAIYYDDIFYGVFLLTDKIYVPILTLPNDLVITSLDAEGKPLASESYTLGEAKNGNVFKTPRY